MEPNIITYFDSVKCTLSFNPLIKFWKKEATKNKFNENAFRYIKERLDLVPEFYKPITDFSVLENNKELIQDLLSICLPRGISKEAFAAVIPDRLLSFYETEGFKKLKLFENQRVAKCFNENCCLTPEGRFVSSYAWLLGHFYGLNVSYEYPLIYISKDETTGLDRYYRIRIFAWFCDLKTKVDIKPLTEEEKKKVIENLDNPKILREIVPPENFELEGFFIFNATEITDHEAISAMKYDLIGKDSLMSHEKFENIQKRIRALLKKPDLRLGLIAFPSSKKDLNNAMRMGNSVILNDDFIKKNLSGECKIYNDVIENREIRMIYDVKNFGCSVEIESDFVSAGVRNLLIAPLVYKDELIGIMELASAVPGDLNRINILKLKEVYPLLAICIESCLDDLNKSVQAVIKEKCTAIHPSVEWRFRDAALAYLANLRNDIIEDMEDIIFDNVNPFYGCSDVKDSSVCRNEAIRSDLLENLNLSREIISKASSVVTMPILEELSFRISNQVEILKKGLSSSIEPDIINFIRNEISSTFEYLKDSDSGLKKLIADYNQKLDPKLGFLFDRRKKFEEDMNLINETISIELDIQQDKAQKIFPHYFEKYKTDGIEYNLYAGSSLSSSMNFNQMHLKSLRLWQLVTTCIITKKCIELKENSGVELDTTHLIFVQNSSITIKFLYDEKKFDVIGSYDLRHEIIKKRIDKAMLKGNKERLVSPGKIAIVYSQEKEAEEYKQYFDFLKTKKMITGEIETLELEDLQGVQGLKALRISVTKDFEIQNNRYETAEENKKS